MKYKIWHDNIIAKAKISDRQKCNGTYYESHHIVPSSVGGSDRKENRVLLTAREHFIIHWLLTKIYSGKEQHSMKLAMAAFMRKNKLQQRALSSRQFEIARKNFAEASSKRVVSDITRERISRAKKGQGLGVKRPPRDADWRHKNGNTNRGKTLSVDHRSKIARGGLGRKHDDATRRTMSASAKARVSSHRDIITCPHCLRQGGLAGMKRWHFEKCKEKP